jgi:glutamine amidotransferase-like uncharacterized protein
MRTVPAGSGELALVYRGPATLPGCPEAVADLLRSSQWSFDVRYVGPEEDLELRRKTLAEAVLYAQPGGGELKPAYRRLRRRAEAISDFVRAGGRYLGFCLGGYLAGETPGFGLLPGDTDQYIASPGASRHTDDNTLIEVNWAGRRRQLFFQDGPYFVLNSARGPAHVVASYDNGLPAAVVAPCGQGMVGVVGPHPEATPDWFTDANLAIPNSLGLDLGLDLVNRVMSR